MNSKETAAFLYSLRQKKEIREGIPIPLRPQNFFEAYQAQDDLVELLLTESPNGRRIGYKVACTNLEIQKMFGLDSPLSGQLLSHSSYPSGSHVPGERLITRCIEAEFAFSIAREIPDKGHPYTKETIADFVDAVIPAIEIVETHYENWTEAGALQLVADNAIHGAWIYGNPCRDWTPEELSSQPVRLFSNEALVREGHSNKVLGHPLTVLSWLANDLILRGDCLKGGDVVSTGLTTDVFLGEAGTTILAELGRYGTVECHLG